MSETPIGLPEDPDDFDLMEWITSGTVAESAPTGPPKRYAGSGR